MFGEEIEYLKMLSLPRTGENTYYRAELQRRIYIAYLDDVAMDNGVRRKEAIYGPHRFGERGNSWAIYDGDQAISCKNCWPRIGNNLDVLWASNVGASYTLLSVYNVKYMAVFLVENDGVYGFRRHKSIDSLNLEYPLQNCIYSYRYADFAVGEMVRVHGRYLGEVMFVGRLGEIVVKSHETGKEDVVDRREVMPASIRLE